MKNLLIFFPYFSVETFLTKKKPNEWESIDVASFAQKGIFRMFKFLRKKKYDEFVIGRPELRTIEVRYYLEAILLLARSKEKYMIDNAGTLRTLHYGRFLFKDTPLIILEGLFSLILIAFSYFLLSTLFIYYRCTQKRKFLHYRNNKITFIRGDEFGDINTGGSFSHVAGFRDGVHELEWDIEFIAQAPPTVLKKGDHFYKVNYPNDFNAPEIPEIYFGYKLSWKAYKHLNHQKPSFIVQRDCAFNATIPLLARILGIPHVLEFNGSEVWIKEKWGKLFLKNLAHFFEHVAHLGADMITVVSDVLKDQLIAKGVPGHKIIINPNGVDPEKFHTSVSGAQIRNKFNLNNKIVLGFIGSFGAWHGIEVLADVISPTIQKNPNLHYLIMGDGNLRPYLEKKIRESHLESHVTLTGTIAHETTPKHLAACDILLSPHVPNSDGSRFFGSPTKLFEYMAMAKPIIASDLEQIGRILSHEKNAILVEPGNRQELADAILLVASDISRFKKLGETARRDVIAHYTWRQNAQRVIHAYEDLICREEKKR